MKPVLLETTGLCVNYGRVEAIQPGKRNKKYRLST